VQLLQTWKFRQKVVHRQGFVIYLIGIIQFDGLAASDEKIIKDGILAGCQPQQKRPAR
jgi:hypothetical protein